MDKTISDMIDQLKAYQQEAQRCNYPEVVINFDLYKMLQVYTDKVYYKAFYEGQNEAYNKGYNDCLSACEYF